MSDTKTLFVRISPESHALLCQIAAHDALNSGDKMNMRSTTETIIAEAAASRRIGPSQKSSETETAVAVAHQTSSSEHGRPLQEK